MRCIPLSVAGLLACLFFSAATFAQAPADQRSDLRILFVGYDPAAPDSAFSRLGDSPRTDELYRERTPLSKPLSRATSRPSVWCMARTTLPTCLVTTMSRSSTLVPNH